ncbi:phosphatase PAP2 family protein [Georgenia satyanarayanai]|uniref:phosphatase PAP2 family protein n=1 Tax=Georgenia satyanarayanai TaxID=860221 RepID=UPI00126462A7|nr:phosphatase PAP2 family protein [Georgenia satyanarayanai]
MTAGAERPAAPRPLLHAAAWWATGLVLVTAALLLTAPSTRLYLAVAHTRVEWPDQVADVLVVALTSAVALQTWRLRRARERIATAVASGVGVLLAYGTSEALKVVLARERPCRAVLPDPQCPGAGNWSFPSNHSTIAFSLATALVLLSASAWAWSAYLAAIATAASRVVDGVHLPHDTLAGAALGICTTAALSILLTPHALALIEKLARMYERRRGRAHH